jgi:hypothetical protein
MKKFYSDGQIVTTDGQGQVVDIQYDQSEGGRKWAEFDEKTNDKSDKGKSDSK